MVYRFGVSIFVLFSIISTGMILYTKTLQENVVVNSGLENAKIYVDGKQKKTSTSDGAYVIASCSMSAGD